MESECLEPLNLVVKKEEKNDETLLIEDNVEGTIEDPKVKNIEDTEIRGDLSLLQEAMKSDDSNSNSMEQKILTAFYMSSLMQVCNMATPRNLQSLNTQNNFMQLLAMVEARHQLLQQMNWNMPSNFLRNPLNIPRPYFDVPMVSLNDQICYIQNSGTASNLSSNKNDSVNQDRDVKQTFTKRYYIIKKK